MRLAPRSAGRGILQHSIPKLGCVRGTAVNDRKHDDLSMWEYLAFIGNRYYVA